MTDPERDPVVEEKRTIRVGHPRCECGRRLEFCRTHFPAKVLESAAYPQTEGESDE